MHDYRERKKRTLYIYSVYEVYLILTTVYLIVTCVYYI